MSTLTNNVVSIDVDNTENWSIRINDCDLDGNPISHSGDSLLAVIKDGNGATVFSAESGDEISIVGGTTNGILLTVPWSVVSVLPAATYYASLVIVKDANNREKIIDLEIRHSVL
jgi:hypothetical protein